MKGGGDKQADTAQPGSPKRPIALSSTVSREFVILLQTRHICLLEQDQIKGQGNEKITFCRCTESARIKSNLSIDTNVSVSGWTRNKPTKYYHHARRKDSHGDDDQTLDTEHIVGNGQETAQWPGSSQLREQKESHLPAR